MLFISSKAIFQEGKAIRGGIPVIFPQFGPGPLPQHGFARNMKWNLEYVNHFNDHESPLRLFIFSKETDCDLFSLFLTVSVAFTLCDNELTRKQWPHSFKLELITTLSYNPQTSSCFSLIHSFGFVCLLWPSLVQKVDCVRSWEFKTTIPKNKNSISLQLCTLILELTIWTKSEFVLWKYELSLSSFHNSILSIRSFKSFEIFILRVSITSTKFQRNNFRKLVNG